MQALENKAILIALGSTRGTAETQEHLDELSFLAETSGIKTVRQFVQHIAHPDPRFFVGKGKIEEIKTFVFDNAITHVIFDEDLSPSQLRNLEREFNPKEREDFKIKIYDRSLLILDIFLWRAQTAQAKTQVELAL